jgi:hypothetical protein
VNTADYWLPERLTWRELDGEWLVYQERTALVLTLEPVAAAVVGMLEDGPASCSNLAARLGKALDLPSGVDVNAVTGNVLTPLWRAGLVARVDSEQPW